MPDIRDMERTLKKDTFADSHRSPGNTACTVYIPVLMFILNMCFNLFTCCCCCCCCCVYRLNILPLHSEISPDEQYKVFLKPHEGLRKVRVLYLYHLCIECASYF